MAEKTLTPLPPSQVPGPIDVIARADRSRQAATESRSVVTPEREDLDIQPSGQPDAPNGVSRVVDQAMGRVHLPTLLELANALDLAEQDVRTSGLIDPGMTDLVADVICDERRKVLRYLDLRDI